LSRTLLATLVVLALATGCKKKAPPPPSGPSGPMPAPAAAPAPAPIPQHVQDLKANFEKVYFDTDSDTLNAESKASLDANVAILQQHVDVKVQVQGHADERGTGDYNLALGNKRAEVVKSYLIGQGVAPSRVTVISYGEEMPAAPGHSESAWAQNRRAEFVVLY
jgi:peptidoglycan-associated lipoprotein